MDAKPFFGFNKTCTYEGQLDSPRPSNERLQVIFTFDLRSFSANIFQISEYQKEKNLENMLNVPASSFFEGPSFPMAKPPL